MAAPHVAGAAALLAAKDRPESLEDVEAIGETIFGDGSCPTGIGEGNCDWTDTSGDGVKEPLLDVSNEEIFAVPPGELRLEPAGEFPASFSLAGEAKVTLHGQTTIKCTTVSEVPALGGEGEFESATEGTATLTLHNCRDVFNAKCTTTGEAEGTIATEALPFRLVYLSDGEPGLLFLPNPESEQLANAKCLGGFLIVDVAGSGVLGRITDPKPGEASETLTIDLNAPEVGEEEYVQEYTETEAGLEYGLEMSVNDGGAKAAPLEAEAVASFAEGEEVELTGG
jgi:hypothetical protein